MESRQSVKMRIKGQWATEDKMRDVLKLKELLDLLYVFMYAWIDMFTNEVRWGWGWGLMASLGAASRPSKSFAKRIQA